MIRAAQSLALGLKKFEELLGSLQNQGIKAVTNVAASLKSCETTLALAENYNFIYGAIGVHPSETAELDENGMERLEHWCGCKKIRAVGEIGLDYYWEEPDHEIQKKWFVRQLDLARRSRLPVIIHSRDAARDTLDIMKAEGGGRDRRSDPLFFLHKGDGQRVSEYGLLSGDRMRPDL